MSLVADPVYRMKLECAGDRRIPLSSQDIVILTDRLKTAQDEDLAKIARWYTEARTKLDTMQHSWYGLGDGFKSLFCCCDDSSVQTDFVAHLRKEFIRLYKIKVHALHHQLSHHEPSRTWMRAAQLLQQIKGSEEREQRYSVEEAQLLAKAAAVSRSEATARIERDNAHRALCTVLRRAPNADRQSLEQGVAELKEAILHPPEEVKGEEDGSETAPLARSSSAEMTPLERAPSVSLRSESGAPLLDSAVLD